MSRRRAPGREASDGGAHHSEQRRLCKLLDDPAFSQNFSTGFRSLASRECRENMK